MRWFSEGKAGLAKVMVGKEAHMNFSSTIEQSSTNSSRPWICSVVRDQAIHLRVILAS